MTDTPDELGPEPVLPAAQVDTKVWSDYWRDTAIWHRRRADRAERERDDMKRAIAVQAAAVETLDTTGRVLAAHDRAAAERARSESRPEALESERAMNAKLTEELEAALRKVEELRGLLREAMASRLHTMSCTTHQFKPCNCDLWSARVTKALNTVTKESAYLSERTMAERCDSMMAERDEAQRRAEAAERERDEAKDGWYQANGVADLAMKHRDMAEQRVKDYEDDAAAVLDEQCAPDEKHCTCVPHLRKRITELQAAEVERFNLACEWRDTAHKLKAERDEAQRKLAEWEQVWDACNEMGAELGDANKPLAVAASWALMQRKLSLANASLAEARELLREGLSRMAGRCECSECDDWCARVAAALGEGT